MLRSLAFVAALTMSAVASAAVYKWIDAAGGVHYSDRPQGDHAELVNIISRATNREAVASHTVTAQVQRNASAQQEEKQKSEQHTEQAVAADLAKAQGKKCADAKERYRLTIESHQLYRQGKNGERVYLSDSEISQARLNARRDLDASCGSAK